MIRKNALKIKLIHVKSSSKSIFSSFMQEFQPEKEVCPCCKSAGNCHIHAYYNRSVIDYHKGNFCKDSLCVMRVVCDSCKHTHAILPDILIPYLSYGILFILQVLADYFARLTSVERICEHYRISPRLLYKWLKIFQLHKNLWLGVLCSMEQQNSSFLISIREELDYSSFGASFISKTTISFLQTHRNDPRTTARCWQT